MQSVDEALQELLGFPGVRSALLAGREGLVIRMRGETAVDGETLAAIVPALIRGSVEAGQAMEAGSFRLCVFEFASGLLVLSSVGEDGILAVAVRGDANIGGLLHALDRKRGRLDDLDEHV
ncbi:MAG: roadblock/LC7 domain-containing protein [Gemmatimonadetes bacterium]|nr:roadblock/LC7 domain-containing protein [Gemmatimonadota bacterium]